MALVKTVLLPRLTPRGPVTGAAGTELRSLMASTKKLYVYKMFAMIAAVHELRGKSAGRRVILFVGNEAKEASFTKGAAHVGSIGRFLLDGAGTLSPKPSRRAVQEETSVSPS